MKEDLQNVLGFREGCKLNEFCVRYEGLYSSDLYGRKIRLDGIIYSIAGISGDK